MRLQGEIIIIKIQDYSGNRTLLRQKCNISDKQSLATIFSSLKAFGIDISRISKDMERLEAQEEIEQSRERLWDEQKWFKDV